MLRLGFVLTALIAFPALVRADGCDACTNQDQCFAPAAGDPVQDYTCVWSTGNIAGSFTPPAGSSNFRITVAGGLGGDAFTSASNVGAGRAPGRSIDVTSTALGFGLNLFIGASGLDGTSDGTAGEAGDSQGAFAGGLGGASAGDAALLEGGGGGGSASYIQSANSAARVLVVAGAGGGSANSINGGAFQGGAAGAVNTYGDNGAGPAGGLANGQGGGTTAPGGAATPTEAGQGSGLNTGGASEISSGGGGGGGSIGPAGNDSNGFGNGGGGGLNLGSVNGQTVFIGGAGAGGASYVDSQFFAVSADDANPVGPQIVITFTNGPSASVGARRMQKTKQRRSHIKARLARESASKH